MRYGVRAWVILAVSLVLSACVTNSNGPGAAQVASNPVAVDDFVGSWAGNWQSDGAPSTLIVSKDGEGKPAVRYTYRANGWNYIGVIQSGKLTFNGAGYYFTFDPPKDGKLNGSMNGPGNISSRISMTRTAAGASQSSNQPQTVSTVTTGSSASPALAPAEFVPPAPGTVIAYRTSNSRGGSSSYRQTIRHDTYKGRPVIVAASPDDRTKAYFDQANGAWLMTLLDGKPRTSAEPSSMDYEWPLQVGKKWVARYKYDDHTSGQSWSPIEQTWTVEGTETITVPAGTFETFRLRSTPGQNVAQVTIRWFAPSVGLYVKQRVDRNADHYQGAGWSIAELTEFQKP